MLANLIGKGRHMRTIPVPSWVKSAVDEWTNAADLPSGALCRAIGKTGRVSRSGFTAKVIWSIVREPLQAAVSVSSRHMICAEPGTNSR